MADWKKILSRGNVEDRRGMSPAVVGGLSLTGFALILLVNYLNGGDLGTVLNDVGNQVVQQQSQNATSTTTDEFAGEDEYEIFASTVLGSNNDNWNKVFSSLGKEYTAPKLVLFRQATQSGCGGASSEVGPHYCNTDTTIYLDETFFDLMTKRFGAKGGDVAQAYVISHEVGHHVQNLLGTLDRVLDGSNDTSIRIELQADCFAGIWANSIKDKGILEINEIKEAMDAAASVGDDRIQEKVQGYTNPESFTHGTSEQRVRWFTTGYENGTIASCETF